MINIIFKILDITNNVIYICGYEILHVVTNEGIITILRSHRATVLSADPVARMYSE